MPKPIRRVAVLGAGTMGGAIAAHVANAGIPVDLLDIVPTSLTPEEEAKGLTLESPEVRNRIVRQGLERVKKSDPPALFTPDTADLIRIGNFENHWERLREADWIVEAVIEKLDVKRQLMARVEEVRKPDAIVSSNTSGIPIHKIGAGRRDDFRAHFLGTHFFNPPRYMYLLEVIPTPDTRPEVVERITHFATHILGKGVVIAKDTPNFIANRIGTFAGQYRLHYALQHGYTVEEVDRLTGPLIGNPKTATFRLADFVGIDVWAYVAQNLYEAVPDDEMREYFKVPEPVQKMVERGWVGNKAGQGFYKRVEGEGGKREYWPINLETLEYEPPKKPRFDIVAEVRDIEDAGERFRRIFARADEDRAARFVTDTTLAMLTYASRRVPEIADTIVDVDRAMRWGFRTEWGPFELWDLIGTAYVADLAEQRGYQVADWVKEMLASGHESFYRWEAGDPVAYYDLRDRDYRPIQDDPRAVNLNSLRRAGRELARNDSASLLDLGDGVLLLEFHAKMNAIDPQIVEMGYRALEWLERDEWVGLVVANQGEHFSAGANVAFIGMMAAAKQFDQIDEAIRQFQGLMTGFRFAPKPVVMAPHGMTLGGGAEVAMHGDLMVASAETYIGLVELGVGLIPAGGGCKEMLRRVVSPPARTEHVDALPFLRKVFETVGMATVARSAEQGRQLGFLAPCDRVVMNERFRIGEAKKAVLELADRGYVPPARETARVYALGQRGLGALYTAIYGLLEGHYISEYDAHLGRKLAYVLCGGDLSRPTWVPEQYILDLEREAFLSLCGEPKTLERITHLLQTGRPLRN